jgi:carboxyl-terminal processing protease
MKIRNKEVPKSVSLIVLCGAIVLLTMFSFWSGQRYADGQDKAMNGDKICLPGDYAKELQGVDFNLFWDTWDMLEKNYVDKQEIVGKDLFYGALSGMVNALHDPYTIFMDPTMFTEFNADMAGSFEGIGAEIGEKDDMIVVVAPLAGMPAEQAGLKSGDLIIKIDNESTADMTVVDAVKKIRGPKDSKVVLTIARNGEENFQDISITRGVITVKSVNYEMLDNDLFVITVSNFNDDTESLFNQAVSEALLKNPKGIILDLRNNPGGYLDTAVSMAGNWLGDEIVVKEDYGQGAQINHRSYQKASLKGIPTVVLVNQGSASASEIVAGALQDAKAATVIGQTTYGKGSVQVLKPLPDGSAIKITAAKWFTPSGRSINEEGIVPDVSIDYAKADYDAKRDPQKEKAIKLLLGK